MTEAAAIYPHQLYSDHPCIAQGRPVYLIEEPLLLTEFPAHRQRLLLHRLSMQAYARHLKTAGYKVTVLEVEALETTADAIAQIAGDGVTRLHVAETTDQWLEQRLTAAATAEGITLKRHGSRLFLLDREDAIARYKASGRHMARFYKSLRQDLGILTDGDDPAGGKWSFDEQNRQKLRADVAVPPDLSTYGNAQTAEAVEWLDGLDAEFYGEAAVWLPFTRDGALGWLDSFLEERFAGFGTYEDALTTRSVRVFHSTLSPLMNIGLLTPREILDRALQVAGDRDVPLNDVEGFVRQVIGWREFIRAAYETDGPAMRTANFWGFGGSLPDGYWTAKTGVEPVDLAIRGALKWGYSHHIERLMVLGNHLLLNRVHPDQVYRWFMALYVDAYDWVMVPNVYGMSQFADGGSFATKPYLSGANYLRKMSDYPGGGWERDWTALYWAFIHDHRDVFERNHRMSMMPKMLDRMKEETRAAHLDRARGLLKKA